MNLFDVKGKKALVTGSTRGLGRSMAEGLMENGVETIIAGTNEGVVTKLVGEYRNKGYACHPLPINLGDKANRRSAFARGLEMLEGRIDILVNAAGIQRRHFCENFPLEDFEEVIEVNLVSVFDMCQMAGRAMIAAGSGKIINVASLLTFFGGYTVPAYAASKGGVGQLTKALSNEWASKNIQVNALAPGYMDTDMNAALLADEGRYSEILTRIPARRWGLGSDMKGPLLFLASAASDYMSGAVIPVDGGYLAR